MKKLILALLLCLLLAVPALATIPWEELDMDDPNFLGDLRLLEDPAGGEADPLISNKYFLSTYYSLALERQTVLAEHAVENQKRVASMLPRTQVLSLPGGQTVELGQGQQFVLLSGSANVEILAGLLLDVTAGAMADPGPLTPGRRYVVCEGSAATVEVTGPIVMTASAGIAVVDPLPFSDVAWESWYYTDVRRAWERGLINGMTETVYAPQGTLTAAQCVKLAACMHQLWHEGTVTLQTDGGSLWYRSYVDYALEHGIMTEEFEDYNAVIDRTRFTHLFYRALPAESYQAINTVPDGSIPDVPMTERYADEIYAFYRAGILTGYDNGAFWPTRSITRAEAAALMSRMFEPESRQQFDYFIS